MGKLFVELGRLCTEVTSSIPQQPLNAALQENWAQAYNAFAVLTARMEDRHA